MTFPLIETLSAITMLTGVVSAAALLARRAGLMRHRTESSSRTFAAPSTSPMQSDPWHRISAAVPGTAEDISVLKRHWEAIDAGLDVGGLTPAEHALRRALREDLPRIADALEETLAVAVSEEERRQAGAHALDSLQSLLAILNAHRRAVFDEAHDTQRTVGRYLDTKREDVVPSGALCANDDAR